MTRQARSSSSDQPSVSVHAGLTTRKRLDSVVTQSMSRDRSTRRSSSDVVGVAWLTILPAVRRFSRGERVDLRATFAHAGSVRQSGRLPLMERWATFDCYGTLVDWNAGIGRELARLFGEDRRDALLERYHWLEPQVQEADPAASYASVMATVLARLAEEEGADLR